MCDVCSAATIGAEIFCCHLFRLVRRISPCILSMSLLCYRMDCEAINNICAKMYTNQICIDSTTKRLIFHEQFKVCCSKNGTVPVIILHDPNNEAKEHVTTKSKPTGANLNGSSSNGTQ